MLYSLIFKCVVAVCITVIIIYLLHISKELQVERIKAESNPFSRLFNSKGDDSNE